MTASSATSAGADELPLADRVRRIVAAHAGERGPLLPILHDVVEALGYVDPAVVPILAAELNLSRADVHGVITFYKDFRQTPAGRVVVRLCRAEACQSRGADALADAARLRYGLDFGETAPDGSLTLDEVFCFGNCALGPSVEVAGRLHGRVDADRLGAAVGAALAAADSRAMGGAGLRDLGAQPHEGDAAPREPGRMTGSTTGLGADPGRADDGAAGTATVYVPGDVSALAVGADEVAVAITRSAADAGREIRLVRNGSRGMLWLEPLVEVATPAGRVAYGPVDAADVAALVRDGLLDGVGDTCLGPTEDLEWLRRQSRVTFARVGVVDPLSADDFVAHGGMVGLQRALGMAPADVVAEVTASGLRGRGGAGFPTGVKWKTVLDAVSDLKFVCCNADEGDSGTFADRMLMEGDPFTLVEGMLIAAHAVVATEGYIYIRSEYPDAVRTMRSAIDIAYARGWLGAGVLGSPTRFDLHVRVGAGAYICGEETSMLESLEGKRGEIRAKPPIPALVGLFGKPTVVNNVLSLASVPMVLADGAAAYEAYGVGRSRGTQVFQLAGNLARGGVVETAFGVTLRELVEDFGGGAASGRPVRAVQVGGPLGAYLPDSALDLPMDYEAFTAARAMIGHGGLVVFDDTVDMAHQARFAMEFCAAESCGKCTPCRVGSVRGVEVIDRIVAGEDRRANLVLLEDLCELMADGSLCAMGGLTPMPVRSALEHFPEDFAREPATTAPPSTGGTP